MGYVIFFAVIVILSFLSKWIIGFSLVLPMVLAMAFNIRAREGLAMAFFSGILYSLVMGSSIGKASLALVVSVGFLYIYGRRFSKRNLIFFVLFSIAGSVFYKLISGVELNILTVVVDLISVSLFLPLVSSWKKAFFSDDIVLRL